MEWQKVTSSNIVAVGYDRNQRVLGIEFVSGGVYDYTGVPKETFDDFVKSGSLGKFFYANIRDKFPTKKVRDNG